jgi:hypothetical protein
LPAGAGATADLTEITDDMSDVAFTLANKLVIVPLIDNPSPTMSPLVASITVGVSCCAMVCLPYLIFKAIINS